MKEMERNVCVCDIPVNAEHYWGTLLRNIIEKHYYRAFYLLIITGLGKHLVNLFALSKYVMVSKAIALLMTTFKIHIQY